MVEPSFSALLGSAENGTFGVKVDLFGDVVPPLHTKLPKTMIIEITKPFGEVGDFLGCSSLPCDAVVLSFELEIGGTGGPCRRKCRRTCPILPQPR